jgi:hypothetical protein
MDHDGEIGEYYQRLFATNGNTYWSSNQTGVATISGNSIATATGAGTTTITATWQDYNAPVGTICEPESAETDDPDNSDAKEKLGVPQPLYPGDPCAACANYSILPTPSVVLSVIPKVQKIQYKEPGTSNYVDITGTLFVLNGTEVEFKAIPNPSNATFSSGKPVWSGTSGATGTGQIKSVMFNTVSSSTTNYKTVIASVNTSVTVNVIVYSLTGTLNPQVYFNGRSNERYGLKEAVNLGFIASPSVSATQIGGLTWKLISGNGSLNNTTTGSDTFTVSATSGSVTLKLEIQNGPSKQFGPQYSKDVVAPTGASMIKSPDNPNLWHCQNYSSVGFYGEVRLEPKDVSFSNLFFREGGGTSVAQGFYASQNNIPHPPTGFMTPVTDCNITTGCKAFLDQVYTGAWPADPILGFYYGDFSWPIVWLYALNSDLDPAFNGQTQFTTATHYHESNNIGTASIQKKGAGPFSKVIGDPDENCH